MEDSKKIKIRMVVVNPKTGEDILDNEGNKVVEVMTLDKATKYYQSLAKSTQKPTHSIYVPDKDSGYVYDSSTNSLVKNEPVVVPSTDTTNKVGTKKNTENPTV